MWYCHLKSLVEPPICDALIQKSEDLGFQMADVRYYKETKRMDKIRNNSRLEFKDNVFLQSFEKKILEDLADKFPYIFRNEKLNKDVQYKKLNDHMRFYRYEPGEFFKPHKDGGVTVDGLESLITVLLYLNDTDGGETVLMPNGPAATESFIKISPQKGDVLMFNHPTWHEGKPVNSGKKYVLRTDVFYTT